MNPYTTIPVGKLFDPLIAPRLPGRLNAELTARLLGFQTHDIPVLIATKLLEPLGSPVPNAPKYFAAVVLDALRSDPAWLDKASKAISRHWRTKNSNKKTQSLLEQTQTA